MAWFVVRLWVTYDKEFQWCICFDRAKVFEDIDRMIHPEHVIDRDVYDVDATIKRCGSTYCNRNSNLSNRDELRLVY